MAHQTRFSMPLRDYRKPHPSIKHSNSNPIHEEPYPSIEEGEPIPSPLALSEHNEDDSSDDSSDDLIKEVKGDLFSAPDGSVLVHACNTQGKWGAGIALEFKRRYPNAYEEYAAHCYQHRHAGQRSGGSLWPKGPKPPMPLTGTCLLIPPQEADYGRPVPAKPRKKRDRSRIRSQNRSVKGRKKVKKHWIACLFTSEGYGVNKDSKVLILRYTEEAMTDLVEQVATMKEEGREMRKEDEGEDREIGAGESDGNGGDEDGYDDNVPGELWACRFNSGKFGVEWEDTKEVVLDVLEKHADGSDEDEDGFTLRMTIVTKEDEGEDDGDGSNGD